MGKKRVSILTIQKIWRVFAGTVVYLIFGGLAIYKIFSFSSLPGDTFEALSSIAVYALMVLIVFASTWLSFKYDKQFRKKIILVASLDPAMSFFLLSPDFLLNLRLLRGSAYVGGVIFYCCRPFTRPLFIIHQYLVKDEGFTSRISRIDIFLSFSLVGFLLISGVFFWAGKIIFWIS